MSNVINFPDNPPGYPIVLDQDGFVKIDKITWEYVLESLAENLQLLEKHQMMIEELSHGWAKK
jgi:hypothetical protein